MLEGLYTAASGMRRSSSEWTRWRNDVANVNTIGYKHTRVGFRDLVYQATGRGAAASGPPAPASGRLRSAVPSCRAPTRTRATRSTSLFRARLPPGADGVGPARPHA